MASVFGYTPEEVDKIPVENVMMMLHLENERRKKEAEDTESKSRR